MNKIITKRTANASLVLVASLALVLSLSALPAVKTAFADAAPTTNDATGITSSDATLNGTNGPADADGHSFWVSTSTFSTVSSSIPDGVYSTPDMGAVTASTTFSALLSSVTTSGVPSNMPAITPSTTYYFVAWSDVGGTWTPGTELSFTTLPTVVAPPAFLSDVYVDGSVAVAGDGTSGSPYQTIAEAMPRVASGGTVHVAAGTYVEQVVIQKPLTLIGAGDATVIESPTILANANGALKAVVTDAGSDITVSNLKIDGAGNGSGNSVFAGLGVTNANVTVSNVTITGIRENPLNGNQSGDDLYVWNLDGIARTASVTGSTFSDFQKNGIVMKGAGLTATVSGNTVTEAGSTNQIAQNGIEFYGSTGSITGNTVSGIFCTYSSLNDDCTADPTASSSADTATGILVYTTTGTTTVSNNTLTGDQTSIGLYEAPGASVSGNTISAPGSGSPSVGIAEWYDSSSAPTAGDITNNTISGASFGLLIDDSAASPATSTLSISKNGIDGNTTAGLWTNASVNANDNYWNASSGPRISGNAGGTGDAITVTGSSTVTFNPWYVDAARTTLNTVAPTITILGSNPVTLTVGDSYTDAGATSTDPLDGDITSRITATSTVSTSTPGTYGVTYSVTDSSGISASSTRTVIVNAFAVAPVSTGGSSSGGDTGGQRTGGGGAYPGYTTTQSTSSTGSTGGSTSGGQVLGAETFNFTNDLSYGMKNSDVLQLQQRLAAEGIFNVTPTGYFGPITLLSVKIYQAGHFVKPVSGFVGPITRGVLNG